MKRLLHLFNNCRLRTKLLISYVSLVVILLAFWGGSAYNQINRQLVENARSDFHNTFSFACLLLENSTSLATFVTNRIITTDYYMEACRIQSFQIKRDNSPLLLVSRLCWNNFIKLLCLYGHTTALIVFSDTASLIGIFTSVS